ncbi:hypothetical protein ERJ70_05095 [Sediminibacillus dalangtanensis]|uniref:Inner spore coat protein D n=1 Tax=Sediminibacillus dalangtanensis TaxID=2729421 RepID=A0ABX7VWN1_9BACI|nr:CotD family spore coat protein [Sediminibacillus dalangtanensis]QTM98727.1 hypothetical protein ERJ70_05095 [Sediminibacillus dalangtanensis]
MGRYHNREERRNAVSPSETSPAGDEMVVHPTERVVNTRTRQRVVKNVHPTEVENVNRTVVRNENYYPVRNYDVNETVVEDYDCGSDLNNPNCRRVSPASDSNDNRGHCGRVSPASENNNRGRDRCCCRHHRRSWI